MSPTPPRRDPVAPGETGNSTGTAADLLASQRDEILGRWMAAAHAQPFHSVLTEGAAAGGLADHVRALLDAIIRLLRRHESGVSGASLQDPAVFAAARAHALVRFGQGLDATAILTEFRLLREEVTRTLREHTAGGASAEAVVHNALDGAVLRALEALGGTPAEWIGDAEQPPESDELLHLLVDRVEDYAIFVLDSGGRVASWNSGAARIKGYTTNEILGQPYATFFTDEDRAAGRPERLLRRARIDGRVEDEGWRKRKDGSRFWADAVLTALYDARGRLRGYAKVTRDLTERRRTEEQQRLNTALRQVAEALAEERERFAAIFNQATAGIAQRDPTGRYVLVNDRFCELVGRPREELLGATDLDLTHPEDRARNLALLARLLERGEGYTVEKRYVRPDGSLVWVENAVSLIRAAGGAPRYVLAVSTDVTDRRRAEAALRASEARSAFLAEAGRVLGSSLDYETTLANVARLAVPHVADWCTVDLLDERGELRRLAVAHADPDRVRLADELQRRYPPDPAAATGPAHVVRTGASELVLDIPEELVERAARDPEHLALLRGLGLRAYMVVPIRVREQVLGAISFVAAESRRLFGPEDLAVAEELAGRAAVAIENARLYRQAQEGIRTRDDFLAAASHDLKNPLASIRGNAQLLLRALDRAGTVPPQRLASSLSSVIGAADQMVGQINELLDVARLRLGEPLPLDRAPVDLVALARRAVAAHQAAGERHQLSLCTDQPELVGEWDAARLERVLGNLLSNAVKYTPDGGEIVVGVRREGGEAVLTVRDTGIGIPAADLARVFERFERARNVVGRIGGSGIGLAASRQTVEEHGGTIAVESREGHGSTFTVRLPLAAPVPPPDRSGGDQGPGRAAGPPGGPATERMGEDTAPTEADQERASER